MARRNILTRFVQEDFSLIYWFGFGERANDVTFFASTCSGPPSVDSAKLASDQREPGTNHVKRTSEQAAKSRRVPLMICPPDATEVSGGREKSMAVFPGSIHP
jgi:hypothetical protein